MGEVCSVTTSSQNDRAVGGLYLSTKSVLNTNDGTTIFDELGDASLLLDDDAFRVADCKVLKALHLGVRDDLCKRPASVAGMTQEKHVGSIANHAGELSIATVGSWLTMTTKSSNLGKVELELVLQPVDSISGTASQDGDKTIAGEVTSL